MHGNKNHSPKFGGLMVVNPMVQCVENVTKQTNPRAVEGNQTFSHIANRLTKKKKKTRTTPHLQRDLQMQHLAMNAANVGKYTSPMDGMGYNWVAVGGEGLAPPRRSKWWSAFCPSTVPYDLRKLYAYLS